MEKSNVVPFGKYKGQPVEVLAQDREYCEWRMAQDWFRVKFQPIYTTESHPEWTWMMNQLKENEANLKKLEAKIERTEAMPVPEISDVEVEPEFEVRGVDVVLSYTVYGFPANRTEEGQISVECKPSLGDEYPAVLRQILGNGGSHSVLLVGDGGYTGTGATLEQIKTIFESREVRIVFLADLPVTESDHA